MVNDQGVTTASYRFMQDLLETSRRDELLRLARAAFPGHPARGGLMTKQQRMWLHRHVSSTLWNELPTEQKKLYEKDPKSPGSCAPSAVASPSIRETSTLTPSPPSSAAPATPDVESPAVRRVLFPDATPESLNEGQACKIERKSWFTWTKMTRIRKKKAVHDLVVASAQTMDEAADFVAKSIDTLESVFPNIATEVAKRSVKNKCRCDSLLAKLGEARESWSRTRAANYKESIDAIDGAVLQAGYRKPALKSAGYKISCKRAIRLTRRRAKMQMGRPSKVRNRRCQQLVKLALDTNSHPSSWTIVFRQNRMRERRRVRNLSANPSTIYRASQQVREAMNIRQFKLICMQFFPEYKKSRLKTDMCDHCENYERKIRPRTRAFLATMVNSMTVACPNYWRALVQKHGRDFFKSHDHPYILETCRKYLWEEQEKADPQVRRAAQNPVLEPRPVVDQRP